MLDKPERAGSPRTLSPCGRRLGSMKVVICLCVLFSVVLGLVVALSPPIPIQKSEYGTRYNPHSLGARVKLEIFLDIHCPDSLALWPEVKRLADEYGSDRLDLMIHLYPLPFHEYSHLATQGFYLVRDFALRHQREGVSPAFDYLFAIMERWHQYSTRATHDKTRDQVKLQLAQHACYAVQGLSEDYFLQFIDYYASNTISAWKYGARRGVAGTPWYFINGVDLVSSQPYSYNKLKSLLDPLVQ